MKNKNKITANILPDNTLVKLAYRQGGNIALSSNIEMMRRLKNSMRFSSWVMIFLTIILVILTLSLIFK